MFFMKRVLYPNLAELSGCFAEPLHDMPGKQRKNSGANYETKRPTSSTKPFGLPGISNSRNQGSDCIRLTRIRT